MAIKPVPQIGSLHAATSTGLRGLNTWPRDDTLRASRVEYWFLVSLEGVGMLLREYLYVDSVAVRGILAQIDAGIVEAESTTSSRLKKTSGGIKGFAEHAQDWGDTRTTTKGMGDALFPALEDALEAEGLLEDISGLISDESEWANGRMQEALPPGKIIRATAAGYLIDARFVAAVLGGFSVTYRGLANMGIFPTAQEAVLPPKAKRQAQKAYKELPGEGSSIEGIIPLGDMRFDPSEESPMNGAFFRGITQVTRGMFAPGLHLVLSPDVEGAGAITIRLQEGRQYLDTDPDILFARYGVGAQEWTVVGTVGHHPLPSPNMTDANFMDSAGNVQRAAFGQYVNQLGTMLGNLGFTDLPQAPGFSVIPWAVYRTIGVPDLPAAESVG